MISLETEWREALATAQADACYGTQPDFGLAKIRPTSSGRCYDPCPRGFWAYILPIRPHGSFFGADLLAFNLAGECWLRLGSGEMLGERDSVIPTVWPTPADWFLNEGRGICWLR